MLLGVGQNPKAKPSLANWLTSPHLSTIVFSMPKVHLTFSDSEQGEEITEIVQ